MMDATTGYIKLNKFSETTYRRIHGKHGNAQKKGMQNLILDLRDNGGGFIKGRQLILLMNFWIMIN
jgi:carboxyl-terminal processing protease